MTESHGVGRVKQVQQGPKSQDSGPAHVSAGRGEAPLTCLKW